AEHLDRLGLARVDGILADLGVSTMQLDRAERGFSFMKEGPLDMRMGADGPTAADLVATASREELTRIFREWGEERMAGPIARTVVEARKTAPIRTTGEMRRLVLKVLGPGREMHKDPAPRARRATLRALVSFSRRPHRQARVPTPHGGLHVPALVPRVRVLTAPRHGPRH